MILAAGLGTRLKPWTLTAPKALVPVDGIPMLERVVLLLKDQGFDYIVVNVHHFANQIIDFLSSHNFGVEIKISDESHELLDTGGGLVKAAPLLFAKDNSPVLVHNVDILSNANLRGLMQTASTNDSGSTLLVSERDSSRKLFFTPEMQLMGWHNITTDEYRPKGFEKSAGDLEFAFSGIYTVSKECIEEMERIMPDGKFPIMDYFLSPKRKICVKGESDNSLIMLDIGKPAAIERAPDILKLISD